jgi:shikimate kinase
MPSDVILIGPPRAGKSTAGKLLAARTGRPFIDLSKLGPQYYAEQGHDEQAAQTAWRTGGLAGFLRYQGPFEVHAVERGLQEHRGGVIELGAFQVAFEDVALFEHVRQVLQPYRHVVLLLPSADVETSVRVLDERVKARYEGVELNEHFVRHHSNHDLAKIRVYTKRQTPRETCDEIVRQLDPRAPEVLLIGPIGAGKSTLGELLAERLGRPRVALDDVRWGYYKEIGYDEAVQREVAEREGFAGVYRYWKRFEAYAVERALQEHRGCVMDFGAGHSVQEDDATFTRIQGVMAPYPNVVLILPSPDLDESVGILADRNAPKIGAVPLTRYLVTHPGMRALATRTVYTQSSTPEETA